jgi:hypothetical protein
MKLNWPLFLAVGGGGLVLSLYLIWLWLRRRSPALAGAVQRLRPWIIFWAFWGGVFGALGAAILMRVAGIFPPEATGWLIFGTAAGLLWGAIWGLVFGLTER